jgi:hypothetical protein
MPEEENTKRSKSRLPSEEEIEALLSQIKPRPGRRFYQIMQRSPWEKPGFRFPDQLARSLAVTAFIVIVILGVTFTIPSVQAAARQLMHYFIPSNSDQVTVQAPLPLPGSQVNTYYALSLDEAQNKAGYPLKTIAVLPDNLAFSGAHFDPSLKAAALRYTNGTDTLVFSQHPLGNNITEYFSIGASATVEPVQVRGVQGEFVSGSWRLESSQPAIQETSFPGTEANLGLYWDASLPQHILRWQENGMAFELLCTGETIGKTKLIEIADSIQ